MRSRNCAAASSSRSATKALDSDVSCRVRPRVKTHKRAPPEPGCRQIILRPLDKRTVTGAIRLGEGLVEKTVVPFQPQVLADPSSS